MDFKEDLLCAMNSNAYDLNLYDFEITLLKNQNYIKAEKLPIFKNVESYVKSGWFNKLKKVTKSVHIRFDYTITCGKYSYNITEEEYNNILKYKKEAEEKALKEKLIGLCNKK